MNSTPGLAQIAVKSALRWFAVYAVIYGIAYVSLFYILTIRPDIRTALSTSIRLIAEILALFITGYTIGKQVKVDVFRYTLLGGAIVSILMLILDTLNLLFTLGFGEAMRIGFSLQCFGLFGVVIFLGINIGITVLGGLAGQRSVNRSIEANC